MKVLVIGSGGREHALIWKLAQSPKVAKVFAAPGNGGIAEMAECLPFNPDKTKELADFAAAQAIDLTVVGPESPLVHGMVDYFEGRGLKIFGPSKAAARLEGSKAFAKEVMQKAGVPTASFQVFREAEAAYRHLDQCRGPVVVKADGLAAGKGVLMADSAEEAKQAVKSILTDRLFGDAGASVVIEERLTGEEVSVLGIVDGETTLLLAPSQDHKRSQDNDEGSNTGGMGAYSPVPWLDAGKLEEIRKRIFEPVTRFMAREGTPFKGVLYAGLMLTDSGPKVLEFNVRFGDPETQAILPRLKTDLFGLLLASAEGKLKGMSLEWDPRACACVVLASQGYPTKYDIGREIGSLTEAADEPGLWIFHAGTKKEGQRLITIGGRVLNVAALGDSLEGALEKVYRAIGKIYFEGMQYRRDIGFRALRNRHPRVSEDQSGRVRFPLSRE
ncbi:MAG: phosphoribosylamine--glycine ligase [Candidatus Omnitrophica bacterium]|nr:phosphoribosylamine--glycine ligase [Candidatus Omnitrophota bacterium]